MRALPALLGSAIVLAACAGSLGPAPSPTAAAAGPAIGGTLRVGLDAESAGWVPTAPGGSYAAGFVRVALYDQLTKRDETGEPKPFLAESVTPDATYTKWAVKLRPNIKFADGTPFTSNELKLMVGELKAAGSNAAASWAIVDRLDVTDALNATFVLKAANAWFSYLLAATDLFKPGLQEKWGKDYSAHPMGTGPFVLTQWDRDQQLIAEKNTYYWRKDDKGRQLPYLDKIIFRPIVSVDTRLSSLKAGDIDTMMSNAAAILGKAEEGGFPVSSKLNSSGYSWLLNNSKAPTDDVRVRRALAYATDKAAVLTADGTPAKYQLPRTQFFAPESPWYSKKVEDIAPKLDIAKAKASLAAYVNDPNRSDKKPVGSPVTLELSYRPQANQVAQVQIAQAQWSGVGIDVKLVIGQEATFISEITKGSFQVAWFQWGEQDAYGQVSTWLNTTNYPKLPSPPLDVLNKLVSAQGEQAKALIEEIGTLAANEVYFVPLGTTVMGFASSAKLGARPIVYSGRGIYATDWAPVWLTK
jgi:peptide/nickel transport system substrate-binding protein